MKHEKVALPCTLRIPSRRVDALTYSAPPHPATPVTPSGPTQSYRGHAAEASRIALFASSEMWYELMCEAVNPGRIGREDTGYLQRFGKPYKEQECVWRAVGTPQLQLQISELPASCAILRGFHLQHNIGQAHQNVRSSAARPFYLKALFNSCAHSFVSNPSLPGARDNAPRN